MMLKNKKNAEKIINFLLNILIFVFGVGLLISIYTGVQTKILGNKYANFFGYSLFEVQTGSMSDTINAGDCIIVKVTQRVKLNDIVTYEQNGEYITHRIIEVYNGTYVTKGDANNAKDDPIDQKQIVGKVVSIWSNFGIIRKTLFNPAVLTTLMITLFLLNFAVKKSNNKKYKFKEKITNNSLFNLISKIFKSKKDDSKRLKSLLNDFTDEKIKEENNFPKESYTEEELEKTSLYRTISVDANEIEENHQTEEKETPLEIEEEKDDSDLEKTSLFRIISVDADEVDSTLLEIAENEMKDSNVSKKEEKPQNKEVEIKEDNALTDIDLDLLNNKKGHRKSKNIIDMAMLIKEEEIEGIINILSKEDSSYINKETIKDKFITNYIDAKYYNLYSNNTMKKAIKDTANKLEDTKNKSIVEKYKDIFLLIIDLEHAKNSITNIKVKNEFYEEEIEKYYKSIDSKKIEQIRQEIMKIQKKYSDTLEYFLKSLETKVFSLKLNKMVAKNNMFGIQLEHNIDFSDVYSDYIIDKTYTEGIVAEDKISILLTLLSIQLIKDMTISNFNTKYILNIPDSMYKKERKLGSLLKIIDDKYAKENIVILITFKDLLNDNKIIKEIRKMGYKFALFFDKEIEIDNKDKGEIYIANYIFINKQTVNTKKILSFIPNDLLDSVIYEDIKEKIESFGGEEE